MKIIQIILTVLLASITIAFVACKKSSISESDSPNYKTLSGSAEGYSVSEDGYLHFANEDIFDATMTDLANKSDEELNEWESMLSYTSSYSYYGVADIDEYDSVAVANLSDEFKNKGFVDPLVLRIVNKDGIIRIGDYLFNMRIDDGYVLQMYAKDLDYAYDDFKNGIFNGRYMNQLVNQHLDELEEGESVFDLLGNGAVGLQPMATWLRDLFGDKEVVVEPTTPTPVGHNPYHLKVVSAYQNVLWYKSWIVKFKHFTKGAGNVMIGNNTEMNILYTTSSAEYKRKGTGNTLYHKIPTNSDVEFKTDPRHKVKWRIYTANGGPNWRLTHRYGSIQWRYWDKWTETYKTYWQYAY